MDDDRIIQLSAGTGTLVQQEVSHYLNGHLKKLMTQYNAATLTPEQAYAGIAICAALWSIYLHAGEIVDTQRGGRGHGGGR